MKRILLALLLMLPVVARAEVSKPTLTHIADRTVLITQTCVDKVGDEVIGWGSGVILSSSQRGSRILSAAHVVQPEEGLTCKTNVKTHAGKTLTISIIRYDTKPDLALIVVRENLGIQTELGTLYTGEFALLSGYPSIPSKAGIHHSITSGEVATIFSDGYFRYSGPAYFGASGGGIFDSDGRLLGILVAGVFVNRVPVDGVYFAASPGLIREFLE